MTHQTKGARLASIALGFGLIISNSAVANKVTDKAIADYLQRHPEAVYGALINYQKKVYEAQQKESINFLKKNFKTNFLNPNDGKIGSDNAKVHLVVFSDRQCSYCKKAWKVMSDLTKKNNDIRVAFKETPILGPGSTMAARIAIWSQQHALFHVVDEALEKLSSPLDKTKIQTALKEVGIKEEEIEKALSDKTVDTILQENRMLAGKMSIQATPTIYIANHDGSQVAPVTNFLDEKALSAAIENYR